MSYLMTCKWQSKCTISEPSLKCVTVKVLLFELCIKTYSKMRALRMCSRCGKRTVLRHSQVTSVQEQLGQHLEFWKSCLFLGNCQYNSFSLWSCLFLQTLKTDSKGQLKPDENNIVNIKLVLRLYLHMQRCLY